MSNLSLIKENLSCYTTEHIDNIDLLKIIIGEKIVNNLINNNLNTIKEIVDCPKKDLLNINGIGPEIANKIIAIGEIAKRQIFYNSSSKITTADDVYNICRDMESFDQEVLRLICLNTKNEVIAKLDLFKGGLNSSIVDPKIIFREALKRNSANIIVLHNHPSGDPNPSKEDINITHRLKEVGKIMSIELLDHIIIGKNKFISLKNKGCI